MKLLLDTCIFLWFISGDNRLRDSIRSVICDAKNEVFLSPVSIWESIVKHQLGKLPLPKPPAEYLPEQRKLHHISSLPLGGCPRIAKINGIQNKGEYKIRPYKRFRGERRGEPCVHPAL